MLDVLLWIVQLGFAVIMFTCADEDRSRLGLTIPASKDDNDALHVD